MKSILKHVSVATIFACSLTPAAKAVELDSIFVPYGFITASYYAADHGIASVGSLNSNMSAPVAAHLDGGANDNANTRSRGAFEVSQSRFGFNVLPKSNVRGKFEFDFYDSTKAAPSTASVLRLRIAKIEWLVNDTNMIQIGQDWDLFNSGVNPHTHNWVGNYFQGGNVGFLRQQLVLLHHTDTMEAAAAVGMAQNSSLNTGAFPTNNSDSDTSVPSLSVKAGLVNGKDKVGVTALYASRISASAVSGTDSSNSHTAFGTAAYGVYNIADFDIHARIYWGQDLKDTGTLSLSAITPGTANAAAHDTHEYGGFISVARPFSPEWSAYGGLGWARIAEESLAQANGLTKNWQVKLGGDYNIPETKAKVFLELTRYCSQYNVASVQTNYAAYLSQLGVELMF